MRFRKTVIVQPVLQQNLFADALTARNKIEQTESWMESLTAVLNASPDETVTQVKCEAGL